MSKSGWGKLTKQQQLQDDAQHFKTMKLASAEEHQHQLLQGAAVHQEQRHYAQLHAVAEPRPLLHPASRATPCSSARTTPTLQDAALAEVNIKTSKLLQILRPWKAQSCTRQAAAARRPPHTDRSAVRSSLPTSCSRLSLVPLSCMSVQLHSDDEDDGNGELGNEAAGRSTLDAADWGHSKSPRNRWPASPRTSPAYTLSHPKLSSPLRACTPFASGLRCNIRGEQSEEELERLQQPDCKQSGSIESGSRASGIIKASSPLRYLSSYSCKQHQPSTPKGYLALYVGEERKRFLVKANLLNHPLFGVLLEKAKEEFGFEQQGPLYIPCEIAFFQHIMLLVESKDPLYTNITDHHSSPIWLHSTAASSPASNANVPMAAATLV